MSSRVLDVVDNICPGCLGLLRVSDSQIINLMTILKATETHPVFENIVFFFCAKLLKKCNP